MQQLNVAWTHAIECENIGGARCETLMELRQLRDKRTTWLGKDINFMFALDKYLDVKGA